MPEYPEQHQLRRAAVDYAVKAGEQGALSRAPSVQLLGKQQPIGRVVFAKRKGLDAPFYAPVRQDSAVDHSRRQLQSGSGSLGGLREQLHYDFGDLNGDILRPFTGPAAAFLAIWQCTHSIGSAAVNGREPVSIW